MRKMKQVVDVEYGIYVWRKDDGTYVDDGDGNIMYIPSKLGDLSRMARLSDAARYWGITSGGPVFVPGARGVTASEFEDHVDRARQGLLPDPYDVGALVDEVRAKNVR